MLLGEHKTHLNKKRNTIHSPQSMQSRAYLNDRLLLLSLGVGGILALSLVLGRFLLRLFGNLAQSLCFLLLIDIANILINKKS